MNTRYFTVKGVVDCYFSPLSGTYIMEIAGIEIQLWHQAPAQSVFLGKGLTNSNGEYEIEFNIESPVSYIVDGKINNVFIKAYYNGELLTEKNDQDAQLYFDQLDPQPSTLFKQAINTLILRLKQEGNWSELDRLWIHATEHQQNARISIVNPSSTPITEVSSPTWTLKEGYTGNGSSSYLNTNYNANTEGVNFTLNNGSVGVYIRTNTDGFKIDIGVYNGSSSLTQLDVRESNFAYGSLNDISGNSAANTDSRGFFSVSRSSSSDTKLWKNGIAIDTSSSNTSISIPNYTFYILARNDANTPMQFSDRQIALTFVGSNNIDQSTFYTALQTFATTIGFNI